MTKPKANRLGMYSDVRKIMDAALAAGGGEYVLPAYGKAIHWRQRAYQFRKLFAELLGPNKESPYDAIIIRRPAEGSGKLLLDIRVLEGDFRPAAEPAATDTSGDDLMDFASSLAAKIKGEADAD